MPSTNSNVCMFHTQLNPIPMLAGNYDLVQKYTNGEGKIYSVISNYFFSNLPCSNGLWVHIELTIQYEYMKLMKHIQP